MLRATVFSLKLPRNVSGLTGGKRWANRRKALPRRRPAPVPPLYPFSSPESALAAAALEQMDESVEMMQQCRKSFARLDVPRVFDRTVAVWFNSNDLRLHDHYACALAYNDAACIASSSSSSSSTTSLLDKKKTPCPLVGLYCFDIRTFCQPSLLGGFMRMSPRRADFLVDSVRALRNKMRENGTELFVRVGLPEVEIPKLAQELGCSAVYASTQYAPHEQWIQERVREALTMVDNNNNNNAASSSSSDAESVSQPSKKSRLQTVWNSTLIHIDDLTSNPLINGQQQQRGNSAEFPERFRLFWDEVENLRIRPTAPYDCSDGRLVASEKRAGNRFFASPSSDASHLIPCLAHPMQLLPSTAGVMSTASSFSWAEAGVTSSQTLLRIGEAAEKFTKRAASQKQKDAVENAAATSDDAEDDGGGSSSPASSFESFRVVNCGHVPRLDELGYRDNGALITPVENVGTNNFTAGEDFVLDDYIPMWLNERRGLREYHALGRDTAATRVPQLGATAGCLGVWLAHGSLSPRRLYEHVREFSYNKMGQGTTELAVRELHQRLARRDFYHFLGVKHGRSFFFPFGPRPGDTDDVPDPRYDKAIVQRWCGGLTGIPFVDASMKEMTQTGWCNVTSRRAMMWTLARGFGQDWRIGAEWFERNLLDYDPFLCYGCAMFEAGIIKDRFYDQIRNVKFLANQADASGIYTRRWLPQLSLVPDMYLHRVHVMTPKMQKMHGVVLGKNYPYPVKLWHGAMGEGTRESSLPLPLPSYFSEGENQNQQQQQQNAGSDTASASASATSSAAEPIIGEIHLEARRFVSLNSKIGWSEARLHSVAAMPRQEAFPALSRVAIASGEKVEDGTAAVERRERDLREKQQRAEEWQPQFAYITAGVLRDSRYKRKPLMTDAEYLSVAESSSSRNSSSEGLLSS